MRAALLGSIGLGRCDERGESSVLIGKVFKYCQENAATGASGSPSRLVLEGEIPVKELSFGSTCRAAPSGGGAEYDADGEEAFPGSGNSVTNKDYEILRLKKWRPRSSARRSRY